MNNVSPDPILAAIGNHRAAWAASDEALRSYYDKPSDELSARHDVCSVAIDAARDALRDARPTTIAGAAALATYLFTEMQETAFDQDDSDLLEALASGLNGLADGRDRIKAATVNGSTGLAAPV